MAPSFYNPAGGGGDVLLQRSARDHGHQPDKTGVFGQAEIL